MPPRSRQPAVEQPTLRGESIVNGLVGNALRNERESRGLSRAEVAAKTKIPAAFVAQLEEQHPALIPQTAYSTIYLKAYCAFLGFDANEIVRVFKSIAAHPDRTETTQRHPTTSVPEWQLVAAPTLIRNVIVGLAVVSLLAYVTFQLFAIVSPPEITLTTPKNGTIIASHDISIEGATEREVDLRINGEPVFLDTAGRFKDVVTLEDGLNVITIVGKKKYGRPQTITRRIIVEPTAPQPEEPLVATTPTETVPSATAEMPAIGEVAQ